MRSSGRRLLLVVVAVVWTLPATGLLLNALQPTEVGATAGWWTMARHPQISLDNLRAVLAGTDSTLSLLDALVDSLTVAVPATVTVVAIATVAAYGLAWVEIPARRWLVATLVVLVILPVQVALVPLVAAYDATGLRGGVVGLWAAHAAFGLPLAVLLLRAAMAEVPTELIDAARTDGAGHLDVLRRVVVPLVVPALVAVATLQFLLVWNDLVVTAALLGGTDGATVPLPLALVQLVGTHPQANPLLAAGAVVTVVVPLVVYAGLSRLVVAATEAVTLGGGRHPGGGGTR